MILDRRVNVKTMAPVQCCAAFFVEENLEKILSWFIFCGKNELLF